MFDQTDQFFMREALKQANEALRHDEVPIGAVITLDNKIIAKSFNQVETLKDPTAHSEIVAITQAANHLSSKWLHNCCMYVTVEPCSMCAGALVLSRIKRLVYGTKDSKAGGCGSITEVLNNKFLNHTIDVSHGLFADECAEIIQTFFKYKRTKKGD